MIGDTPADIRCGEEIGARAIGVATGRYSVDELAETILTRCSSRSPTPMRCLIAS